jgi:hypothetical protein
MALVLNGSGSITGLSAGGLPDGSVTADDIASLPAGSVIQVVQGTLAPTLVQTSSTSFVTSTLSASITPSSSSNKILVMCSGGAPYTEANGRSLWLTIYRNSTNLGNSTYGFGRYYADVSSVMTPMSMTYLDSPATTSSTTYAVYFRSSGATVQFSNIDRGTSTITLMEIAA